MAWISAGGSASHETTDTKTDTYGTHTPNLSDDWLSAFKRSQGNLNTNGYTTDQQKAIDYGLGSLNTADKTLTSSNADLLAQRNGLGDINSQWWSQIASQAPRQLGQGPSVGIQPSAYAGDITAQTGAQNMGAYADPFLNDVVANSVNDYNVNTDRTLNGIRAGRDASGAFGDRAAIADSAYLGDATRGLGTLVSGLYSQGFNTAAGLGQQDASRSLLADQSNQSTRQNNNQFNSTLLFNADKYNADMANNRDQFNVDAGFKSDANKAAAVTAMQDNLKSQAGLTQQTLDNVFKGTQIDTDAAQALFAAGQIGQDQLNQILQLASQTNGYSYTQDTNSNSTKNSVEAHAGIGK